MVDEQSIMTGTLLCMVMMLSCTLAHQNVPPIQMQQAPGSPPGHSHPHQTPQQARMLHDQADMHNKDHLMEHYDGVIDAKENLSDDELNFHYFKVHDYDKNNKLDGIELISALTHFHKNETEPDGEDFVDDSVGIELISQSVDSIMSRGDKDNDGYMTYAEYVIMTNSYQLNQD